MPQVVLRIDLSGLTTASSITMTSDSNLQEILLGDLQSAGYIAIAGNPSLETVDLSSLETVDTTLEFSANYDLSDLNLDALTSVGDLYIRYNTVLACDADAITDFSQQM